MLSMLFIQNIYLSCVNVVQQKGNTSSMTRDLQYHIQSQRVTPPQDSLAVKLLIHSFILKGQMHNLISNKYYA